MNERITFRDGVLGMSVTTDEINEHLRPHGLCIAPLPAPAPPPQTEAERLVEIAKGLPREAWEGSGWSDPYLGATGNACSRSVPLGTWDGAGLKAYAVSAFRTILLGVMAAYVGTEPNADARLNSDGTARWFDGEQTGRTPDLLTAYAACCKAIAERRKVGTDA